MIDDDWFIINRETNHNFSGSRVFFCLPKATAKMARTTMYNPWKRFTLLPEHILVSSPSLHLSRS
jgi:hypothetical protein